MTSGVAGTFDMSLDFSSLLLVLFLFLALQPLIMGRWYTMQRVQAIRAIEKKHGTRVITMIHRQEKRSLFGFAQARYIDLEDAQTIIAAIKETPDDVPIDLILHTPGGLGARGHADRACGRGASGQGHGLCADLRHVGRYADCARGG